MRIVVSGASGLIGSELLRQLALAGDEVVRLVRRTPAAGEVWWDPVAGRMDPAVLRGAGAVVNLSGAPLARLPWTGRYRAEILGSRLAATRTLVGALHRLDALGETIPSLINASAVGFYGSRPGVEVNEASGGGSGFLADVVQRWEDAALAAPAGCRTVLARTGVVLGPGGALAPLLRLARAGLAGPLGSGRQHWPWISLRDEAAAIVHLIRSDVSGPVNLVGPGPATAGEIGRAIARRMHRPYWVPAPAPVLAAVLGDAARELILADQLVRPDVLTASGFAFLDNTADAAVEALLP